MHCSILWQNFSIFKKLEKFIQRYTLGQIFPFLSGGKLEKFERVIQNGPHEGVRPDDDEMSLKKGVRPNDDRSGPLGCIRPDPLMILIRS